MLAKQQMPKHCARANICPISVLQEFVQSSKSFPLPSNCTALHWTYDQRMASTSALEYLATVAFYLDGVPHHAVGGWHASKKGAQRDAADKALGFFAGRWRVEATHNGSTPMPSVTGDDERLYEEKLLEDFCTRLPACTGGANLCWSILPEGSNGCMECDGNSPGRCFAIVEVELSGVPHRLAGAVKASEKEAILDTARRALWYLQCPGFEHEFQPQELINKKRSLEIPAPPVGWAFDGSSEEALEEANRKTIVMRVQNRLQREFARLIVPGQSVWEWSYVSDSDDKWPPLFCATVKVPILDREFSSDWVRGQRDAQINAIERLSQYLDDVCCFGQEQTRGKGARRSNHNESSASPALDSAMLFQF